METAVATAKAPEPIDENVFVQMMLDSDANIDEGEPDNGVQEKVGEGDGEEQPKPPEKEDGGGEEDEELTEDDFADDVIPGVKGADMAKLSRETQLAIAKFHDEHLGKAQSSDSLNAELTALKADPIVAHRLAAKSDPNSLDYSPTDDEVNSVLNADTVAEAKKALAVILERKAARATTAHLTASDAERQKVEVRRVGTENLLSATNMNPELALKETNLAKLVPGHPEWDTYEKGLGKILGYYVDKGFSWNQIAKMDPKEVYASVAAKEGWTVALNTAARDKKIAMSTTRMALKSFLKSSGRSADATAQNMTSSGRTPGSQQRGEHVVDGIDLRKIATDEDYHEQVLLQNQNPRWANKVAAYVAQGEKLMRAQNGRSRSVRE